MAETLTYDTTPETEVLTPDEQDSLEIGEKMVAEQEGLLAGKYKDPQELEKAYLELQTKLGSNEQETSEELEIEPEGKKEEKEDEVTSDLLDRLWDEAQGKNYKDETLKELSEMSSRDLAQMHLKYRADNQQTQPQVISEQQVTQLKDIAGGDKGYTNMMGWAKDSLAKQEIDMYDAVMERGEPLACYFAVQALKYRFDDASGVDGEMLTGKASSSQGSSYQSQAQLVKAMEDPRYENDTAYRQDVMKKLERSNIQF